MGVMLSEPAVVRDDYITGLAYVDKMPDGNFRLTYYTTQRSTYDGESHDLVVKSRHVMSMEVMIKNIQAMMTAAGVQCCGGERIKRLVN